MASRDRRDASPSRPTKARTKYTVEREVRKERGTPERTRDRDFRVRARDESPRRRERESINEEPSHRPGEHRRSHDDRRRQSRKIESRSHKDIVSEKHESYESSHSGTHLLSSDALAQLDSLNEKADNRVRRNGPNKEVAKARGKKKESRTAARRIDKEQIKYHKGTRKKTYDDDRRRVSGPMAEEGRIHQSKRRNKGYVSADEHRGKKRFGRKCYIGTAIVFVIVLIVAIAVGVTVAKNKAGSGSNSSAASNLNNIKQDSIPADAKGSVLDPFTWYETKDLNVTFTPVVVGGLSVMGLFSSWDDSTQANGNVPPLSKPWAYGKMPIRGINIGGWLSIEPFITPSLFNSYKLNQGVVDEYTLTKALGASLAAATLEKHYATFITESDFAAIQAAGFDHVRIPYSYWAVTTYDGDPYVPKVSWRYLLRGIEYARKHGLRVNLDLHGLPGSQNGWNHSGRQGAIGWLNGTDGQLNAQRSLDIHTQLATFFAQDRYKNIITIYGLANEPKMTKLAIADVVAWTATATQNVRKAGLNATIAFGDGFLGLTKWQGQLQGVQGLVLDAHEYVIFDPNQISLTHQKKLDYACTGWSSQMAQSTNTATGFGPTLCGEWSQADTDCTQYLNDVGAGTRWEGTLQSTEMSVSVLTPSCPAKDSSCSCAQANADPSSYSSQYKQWLLMNAEAQMASFETAWGWFYWTWKTESATQWDYQAGMSHGILPQKTWDRKFSCSSAIPDFHDLSESY